MTAGANRKAGSRAGSGAGAGSPRSAARLAAVQAHYQLMSMDRPDSKLVAGEFIQHRVGQMDDDIEYVKFDTKLFEDICLGSWSRFWECDAALEKCLPEQWPLQRLERTLHAILRCAVYELIARPDVPTKVVINEYLDVAHGFYERSEVSFINGVLDTLGKRLRPAA